MSLYPPPPPRVQTQNQGVVGAGQYNFVSKVVVNYDGLRNFPGLHDMVCLVLGKGEEDDGGESFWWYDSTNINLDNNLNCIAPNGTVQGRWLRLGEIGPGPAGNPVPGHWPNNYPISSSGYSIYIMGETTTLAWSFSEGVTWNVQLQVAGGDYSDLLMAVNDGDYYTLLVVNSDIVVIDDFPPSPAVDDASGALLLSSPGLFGEDISWIVPPLFASNPGTLEFTSAAITANGSTILIPTQGSHNTGVPGTYAQISTNSGSTWSNVTSLPSGVSWVGCAFGGGVSWGSSGNIYMIPTEDYMYVSTNGGSSFSQLATGPIYPTLGYEDYSLRIRASVSGTTIATLDNAAAHSSIGNFFISHNSGSSWASTNFNTLASPGVLSFIDYGFNSTGQIIVVAAGLATGTNSIVWKSTDGGATWSTLSPPSINSLSALVCNVATDGLGVAIGYNNSQTVDISLDGGTTWSSHTFVSPEGGGQWDALWIVPALPSPPIIPDSSSTGSFSASTSGTATITTGLTNDIIIISIHTETLGATSTVVSVSDTAGLSWTKRSAEPYVGEISGYNSNLEVWWAYSASTLSADVITVTVSHTVDDGSIIVYSVNGANTSTPFDANVSLPAKATGSSPPSITGISTTSSKGQLVTFCGSANEVVFGAGGGLVSIANIDNTSGTNYSDQDSRYKPYSTAQSGVTLTYGGTWTSFIIIADAIVPA